MKATTHLRTEQLLVDQFLTAFHQGSINLTRNLPIEPEFFIYACTFIQACIEQNYFRQETLLLQALLEGGLSPESGPLTHMFSEINQLREISTEIMAAAQSWQTGNKESRNEIVWDASSYTSLLRQHLERARTIIFPLADQMLSPETQETLAETFQPANPEEFILLVATLEKAVKQGKK